MAEDDTEQSPFARAGFIVGAIVLTALVVAALVFALITATNSEKDSDNLPNDDGPAPAFTTTTAPSPEPTADADGNSVCGLHGAV